jgi:hypothetical protein
VRARVSARGDAFHRLVFRARTRDGAAETDVTAWLGRDERTRRDAVGPFASEADHGATLAGVRASWAAPLAPWLRARVGLDAEAGDHRLVRLGSLAVPPREGDPFVLGQVPPDDTRRDAWTVRALSVAPWIELPVTLFGSAVQVTPALRLDGTLQESTPATPPLGDTIPRGAARVLFALQPRIEARVNASRALALAASYGLYAMPPAPEDLSATFGNPALDGALSQHATLGAMARAFGAWTFAVTGYLRHTEGVAVRPATIPAAGAALNNQGREDGLGAQLVVRCAPWHGFSGWVAYTLSRTTVVTPAAPAGRLADTDQTHLLAAAVHYAAGRGFSLGARVRVASGLPRTPVVGRALDATSGDVQPVFGATNSERLPTYVGVDVRADWRGNVAGVPVGIWLDVLNVTGQASVEDVLYDPTYRERRYVTGVPFFVDVGARAEF